MFGRTDSERSDERTPNISRSSVTPSRTRPNERQNRSALPTSFVSRLHPVNGTVQGAEGARALREFQGAPAEVRDEFVAQVAAATERQRAIAAFDPYGGEHDPGRWIATPVWGEEWRRKASLVRARAEGKLGDIDEQREALLAIPAPSYFAKLTGDEVPRTGGRVCCPNPDHEDLHPDCHVYAGQGWRCFACHEQGGIYQLGALVWGLDTRGPDFMELHRRLCGAFGIEARAAA